MTKHLDPFEHVDNLLAYANERLMTLNREQLAAFIDLGKKGSAATTALADMLEASMTLMKLMGINPPPGRHLQLAPVKELRRPATVDERILELDG